jgi:hypothetical protein
MSPNLLFFIGIFLFFGIPGFYTYFVAKSEQKKISQKIHKEFLNS